MAEKPDTEPKTVTKEERWVEGNPEQTLINQEKYVIEHFSGFEDVFKDCSRLIAKARNLVVKNKGKEAKEVLAKLEAKINISVREKERWIENNPHQTLENEEVYLINTYSNFKAVFDDCSRLIAKARDLEGKSDRPEEFRDTLLKLEARLSTADKSVKTVSRHKWWIAPVNIFLALVALAMGWGAICGPYLPCRGCDNSTQNIVVAPASQNTEQASKENPMEKVTSLTLVNWVVLGFAAGMLGGTVIALYGLVYHALKGDFLREFLIWYGLKWIKGGLSGLVAVLPFMAGLAVFNITTALQAQVTIAYVSVVSFLVGYNEGYFLQLLSSVGKTIFKPAEANGGTNNTTAKPG